MQNILGYDSFLFEKYWDIDMSKKYVMYHATPEKNVESIMKNGIKPSIPSGKPFSEPLVWMADNKDGARKHAESRMKKRGDQGKIVILELEIDPNKVTLHKGFSPGVYNAEGIIPPEMIKGRS